MVNPYSKKDEERLENSGNQNQPDNVEHRDSDWFASYE
jgi:hypothetical protein